MMFLHCSGRASGSSREAGAAAAPALTVCDQVVRRLHKLSSRARRSGARRAPGARLGITPLRPHTRAMPAKKRGVYLNADLHKELRAKSAAMDLTVAELVSKAVRVYLADAADEATFGRQEPTLSFRAGRASKTRTKSKSKSKRKR
jgi:hypothetical protein